MIPPIYVRHFTEDRDLSMIQDRLKEFVKPVEDFPLLMGALLRDVNLFSSKSETVPHKLDRRPQGYIVTRRNANAVVYETAYAKEQDKWRFLNLRASADVTVDLWVF